MKVLYIAPEHVTGGFSLFAKGHRARGNECRWVTFFRNRFGYEEDICLRLSLMPDRGWVAGMHRAVKRSRGEADIVDLAGNPPLWRANTFADYAFFKVRDLLNAGKINRAIAEYKLEDFDLYHFEQGIDFFRDGRWVKRLAKLGKGIVSFYHGSDLRNRGVMREVYRASHLNLTSEIDLMSRIPGMRYLYLPIDTDQLRPLQREPDGRIRVCHAARNRKHKGSDFIEAVVRALGRDYPIEWVMIENTPHHRALEIKAGCDIFIDQITDSGGWGYGASSAEALALGLPTMTRINPQVEEFLGGHPFISVTPETFRSELLKIIESDERRRQHSAEGRMWVVERHGLESVINRLYGYYSEAKLI